MKFTCLICKEKFDNILSLRKHMKDHLNDSKWVWGFNPSFSIGFWNLIQQSQNQLTVKDITILVLSKI